ncbi:AAA family ATPase [Euryhalocaulis caribicus]|uniref:AAA family ATPase n=1 Tax=Euryhalocaulis caribicus TaxID=1161401 RepID=UPI00039D68C4|nr:MoxR family ATPase [Euryhalocaulis caribicus]
MNDTALQDDLVRKADDAAARLAEAREAAGKIILGQDEVLDLSFGAILAGGHGLLVGAPGLAKTKLVETLGVVLGLDSGRVQFTPDLMPPDILGSEVLEEGADGKRAFRFIAGPIFCQLLMADEINRASPRTQSALLQAMQEHHVTVAGKRYDLPEPFHVLATQNPIEQEGTYPLPEAQLDRFLYQIDVPYPKLDAERDILLATTGSEIEQPKNVLTAKELMEAQALVRQIPVGEKVLEAILKLVRLARPDDSPLDLTREFVAWGPGPRAGQALMLGVRARALMTGRLAPSTDDVARLAKPALKHRMALSFGARAEGVTLDSLIDRLISELD